MIARHQTHDSQSSQLPRLATAILALLIERPSHAYDVWRRCEERFGSTLYASNSKVYRECRRLLVLGLIEEIEDDRADGRRQQRFPYRATAAGARLHRERIVGMLRNDPRTEALRERMLSVGPDDVRALRTVVDRLEEECLDAAAELAALSASAPLRDRLVAEHSRMLLTAQADFVKRARAILAEEATP